MNAEGEKVIAAAENSEKDSLEAFLEKKEREDKLEAIKKALLRGDKDGLVVSLAEVIHSYPADIVQMILDLPYFDREDEKAEAAKRALMKSFHDCLAHQSEEAEKSMLEIILQILTSVDIDFTPRFQQFSRFCGHWKNRGMRGLKGVFSRVAEAFGIETDDAPVSVMEETAETDAAPAAPVQVVELPADIKLTPVPKKQHAYVLAPKPPTFPLVSTADQED